MGRFDVEKTFKALRLPKLEPFKTLRLFKLTGSVKAPCLFKLTDSFKTFCLFKLTGLFKTLCRPKLTGGWELNAARVEKVR